MSWREAAVVGGAEEALGGKTDRIVLTLSRGRAAQSRRAQTSAAELGQAPRPSAAAVEVGAQDGPLNHSSTGSCPAALVVRSLPGRPTVRPAAPSVRTYTSGACPGLPSAARHEVAPSAPGSGAPRLRGSESRRSQARFDRRHLKAEGPAIGGPARGGQTGRSAMGRFRPTVMRRCHDDVEPRVRCGRPRSGPRHRAETQSCGVRSASAAGAQSGQRNGAAQEAGSGPGGLGAECRAGHRPGPADTRSDAAWRADPDHRSPGGCGANQPRCLRTDRHAPRATRGVTMDPARRRPHAKPYMAHDEPERICFCG